MKKVLIAAATLVLGLSFAPAAYAETDPSPDPAASGAGTSVEHVALDPLAGGATTVDPDKGGEVSVPAGPAVVYDQAQVPAAAPAQPQIQADVVPAAPSNAGADVKSSISVINSNGPRPFTAEPLNSIPGVISFVFIMALCVGAGVAAAVLISLITGKKISLGLSH